MMQPAPEYPGNNLPDVYLLIGFDPSNLVTVLTMPMIYIYAGAEEALLHMGPEWNWHNDQDGNDILNSLMYSVPDHTNNATETWLLSRSGTTAGGENHGGYTELEITKASDCSLFATQYETNGVTRTQTYEMDRYSSLVTNYENNVANSYVDTQIAADGSDESVIGPVTPDGSEEYPYTIIRWQQNGANVITSLCRDAGGADCIPVGTP